MKGCTGPGRRAGFTAIEMLVVVTIVGILLAVSVPQIMRWVSSSRVDNAARVVASDLRLAGSLAVRQGRPVLFEVDEDAMTLTITDAGTGDQLHRRWLGAGTELAIQSITAAPTSISIYPNRTASGAIQIVVGVGVFGSRVRMSSASFIQVDRL